MGGGRTQIGSMQDIANDGLAAGPAPGDKFDPDMLASIDMIGHNSWLGMQFRGIGDGWVELSLPWHEKLVADEESGILASGPIVSLMDMTAGLAVWLRRDSYKPHVTMDLRVDYMRPARPRAPLIARAECYRHTRTIAFVRGIAYDGTPDDPVAHAAGTFMIMPDPAV